MNGAGEGRDAGVDARRGAGVLLLGTGLACTAIGGGVTLFGRVVAWPEDWGMPVVETVFTLLVFGLLAGIAIVAARLQGLRAGAMAPTAGRHAALGVAIGAGGLMAALLDARMAGTLVPGAAPATSPSLLVWGAAVVLVQAGGEELFFRGWLQRALVRHWGTVPAIGGAALAFSLTHLAGGTRGPLTLINLLLGGLVFGALAVRTGGLAAAIGAHWGWNATEQLIFGLDPNPGIGSFGAVIDHDLAGPALWGGSAEGLNAALPMTLALIAMLAGVAIAIWGASRTPISVNTPPALSLA